MEKHRDPEPTAVRGSGQPPKKSSAPLFMVAAAFAIIAVSALLIYSKTFAFPLLLSVTPAILTS